MSFKDHFFQTRLEKLCNLKELCIILVQDNHSKAKPLAITWKTSVHAENNPQVFHLNTT